ncbi:adenylate/guanylate cyclase domain-containing protein [Nocardioides sp.]|uniref:adenylate/guanylate cyclase domain-containing protein n=1 Tax=Nocardioides sp. TaxID=35761 RepID=UPI00271EDEBE|nr:adenylate/guanylate cyclase domain-containing protein [Nocardioides sp.]MDO9458376.1 adenylate/guanylate cyclase domain-containing protein [Nocardioides sp.]
MVWVLLVVTVALTVTVGVLLGTVRRHRAELAGKQARIDELEADLSTALRPRPASSAAERAVRRVVQTATKVRERGLSGVLASSIDDLQTWAASEQQEILNMADADGRVTLVFSDIEDSTALNERLGDDTWVRVLAAHDALIRGRVERYRGQVVKSFGDGFMIAFRDAEAACRAAVGVQKDLRRTLDPMLRVVAPVRVRIGIHTGEVISKDGDYFGRNVAMAARVGALATGGEVLATHAVAASLDDDAAVRLVEMGEVELKGLPGSHSVFRVVTQ